MNCLRWRKVELRGVIGLLVNLVVLEPRVHNVESCIVHLLIGMLLQLFDFVDHVRLLNLQRQLISATRCVGHVQHVCDTVENDLNE